MPRLEHGYSTLSSKHLLSLVEHSYPNFPARKDASTAGTNLSPAQPFVSLPSATAVVSSQQQALQLLPLPSGRRKDVYALLDRNDNPRVLQLQKPGFFPEELEREVALTHTLNPYLQPSEYADSLVVLNHQGVVKEAHGNFQRYLGPDWQTLLSSPNLTLNVLQELLGLLPDIAQQLIYIHQCGYRHRDIRLENMTVESVAGLMLRGHLIDFGLAKPLPEECCHTGFTYYGVSPGDWDGFVKTIERILSARLPMLPLTEETLINYCAMVRTMIQYEDFASLTDLQLHREYFQPLNDAKPHCFRTLY